MLKASHPSFKGARHFPSFSGHFVLVLYLLSHFHCKVERGHPNPDRVSDTVFRHDVWGPGRVWFTSVVEFVRHTEDIKYLILLI